MNVLFIASVGVVAADPPESRKLYVDALGLPLEADDGGDYWSSGKVGGSKHFGVWPLSEAAQACFGSRVRGRGRPGRSGRRRGARGQGLLATALRPDRALGPERGPAAVGRGLDRGDLLRAVVSRLGLLPLWRDDGLRSPFDLNARFARSTRPPPAPSDTVSGEEARRPGNRLRLRSGPPLSRLAVTCLTNRRYATVSESSVRRTLSPGHPGKCCRGAGRPLPQTCRSRPRPDERLTPTSPRAS